MTRTASILCVLLGLASLHTWPIARAPGRESLNHNADAQLCAWTMSWIAHALPRDPLHLFDAPIFWPERQTMTYTDPMLPPAHERRVPGLVHAACRRQAFAVAAWQGPCARSSSAASRRSIPC